MLREEERKTRRFASAIDRKGEDWTSQGTTRKLKAPKEPDMVANQCSRGNLKVNQAIERDHGSESETRGRKRTPARRKVGISMSEEIVAGAKRRPGRPEESIHTKKG